MTHESPARDAVFLGDLAVRIFRNATPAMGFDQGDADQLHRIAAALTTAPQGIPAQSSEYTRGIETAALRIEKARDNVGTETLSDRMERSTLGFAARLIRALSAPTPAVEEGARHD